VRCFVFLGLAFILFSCANDQEVKLREFVKNNHDLPEIKKFYGLNHTWMMSNWFTKQTSTYVYPDLNELCIADKHIGYSVASLNVYLTIEDFKQGEIDEIHFIQDKGTKYKSLIQHYLDRFEASNNHTLFRHSIPLTIKNSHGYKIQFYHLSLEPLEDYYSSGNGFLAVLQRRNEYVVIQCYASEIANAYIADDFIRILQNFD